MKKVIILISSLVLLSVNNACSNNELELLSPTSEGLETIDTEDKLQSFLNGAYLNLGSVNAFGTNIIAIGDVLSDHLYPTTASATSFNSTYNMNYSAQNNDFTFYDPLYDAINDCNMIINSTKVASNLNVQRIKAEAKIIRGFAYFTLVNYYSPSPTSGVNQEYGVPLVLGNYDASIQPGRATIAEVYNQIISDLTDGMNGADDLPVTKSTFNKRAAKLLLSRVYLTRRAPGDAQLALQYSSEIVDNPTAEFKAIDALKPSVDGNPNSAKLYELYFSGLPEATSENHPETIFELDVNSLSNAATGLGSNLALPTLYYRLSDRKALLFTKSFIDTFPHTDLPNLPNGTPQSYSPDVRRGSTKTSVTSASTFPGVPTAAQPAGLLSTIGVAATDNPAGAWTNKYPRLTEEGNFQRNIKILRFAEAQLNKIEALYLTGQTAAALSALNTFAASRGGSTYNGADLLNDILTEKGKEFYGEGQRFLDLKRWNLPLVKNSNCTTNCNVPADSKLFVLPMSQIVLNANVNLKQYPGY